MTMERERLIRFVRPSGASLGYTEQTGLAIVNSYYSETTLLCE